MEPGASIAQPAAVVHAGVATVQSEKARRPTRRSTCRFTLWSSSLRNPPYAGCEQPFNQRSGSPYPGCRVFLPPTFLGA